jgi:predicted phosphodiesterase
LKIRILSDLHLEFKSVNVKDVDCDVVVLAGDIHVGTLGMAWARDNFPDQHIIYVAGNHEFYKHNHTRTLNHLRETADEFDIKFLENDEVIIDGVRFLGCTLWTDYKSSNDDQIETMIECNDRISDHRLITILESGKFVEFTTNKAYQLHLESKKWLTSRLYEQQFKGKTVVVTHHGPSNECAHKKFPTNIITGAFHSDISSLLPKSDLWIYGHTHSNLDKVVNDTRLISNQKGYPDENISDYDELLTVSI